MRDHNKICLFQKKKCSFLTRFENSAKEKKNMHTNIYRHTTSKVQLMAYYCNRAPHAGAQRPNR